MSTAGVILAALYLLWAYQRVFHGTPEGENAEVADMSRRERVVMVPVLALIVFLGVYPQPVLDRINPSVERLVEHVEEEGDYHQPSVAAEHGKGKVKEKAEGKGR